MATMLLNSTCDIKSLSSYEEFAYHSDYIYKNEYMDCWMLYYVEKGGLEFSFSNQYDKNVSVEEGQLFLQPPYSDYSYRALPGSPAQIYNLGFQGNCENLLLLSSQALTMPEEISFLLDCIRKEARKCFSPKPMADGTISLEKNMLQPYGGEQIFRNLLELLLIALIRNRSDQTQSRHLSPEQNDSILFRRITDYYMANITSYLSLEEICKEFQLGQSHLQRIFRNHTDMGAIEYFCHMRIDTAKKIMREEQISLKETASRMGYHSTHYFSKQFKQITNMTPTQYLKMVKSSKENPFSTKRL